ncbi:unnamed protein product, partial [Phaeothamnion confervicola]
IGYSPIFVGEILLLSGIFILLFCTPWWRVLEVPAAWPLVGLMFWGLVRTIPYISEYRVDAFRDAVIWGYGIFAFILFGCLVASPKMLPRFVKQYHTFSIIFLSCVPVVMLLSMFLGESIPKWPGSGTPIITNKCGDVLVHLGGILAYWTTGLCGNSVSVSLLLLFTLNVAIMGIQTRGGL